MSDDDTSGVVAFTKNMDWLLASGCFPSTSIIRPARAGNRSGNAATAKCGRDTTMKVARSSTSGYLYHVSISAKASAPVMKKICDTAKPVEPEKRVNVSAV